MTSFLFGNLSLSALPPNPIAMFGALTVVVGFLSLALLITYLRRWQWLWREWATSLDAKRIGIMYIVVSAVMLVRGGADMILMRLQQASAAGSSTGILSASHFQEIFSAHGTIMIFFVAMGLMFGLINLVVPLQIGARDVAFPFLNNVSFWLFAAGVVLINCSLLIGDFSTAGWLAYPPLSELQYSPTTGVDYWIWSLELSGIGSLLSGINFMATIIKKRCRGMDWMRLPMFSWSVLGAMTLVVAAFPILTVTLTLLALDRTFGFHFFTAGGGGNMMMYVNLIWAWGHPEVYILVLPAFGIFSEVVPVFSGKKLAGYTSMVLSIWAIVFLSFFVWLHHFFTMGAGADVNTFFGVMTMVIAVPTGVKMFNWIFTMYRGSIRFATPMLWFMGFVVLFTLGGVAGVVLSEPAADYQLHNSLFLVAHFHTMIVSGVLFGYFAGLIFWLPKFLGFALDERWGRRAFWSWLVGFILAFGPLYILGFMGATRRLDHYANLSWQPFFIVAAVGAILISLGFFFQLVQIAVSIKNRKTLAVGSDPWDGRTLEWSVATPPPAYNFSVLPSVSVRDAFWYAKEHKEKIDARRDADVEMPQNTGAGAIIALGSFLFAFGFIWHIWWLVVVGLIISALALLLYTFRSHDHASVPIAAFGFWLYLMSDLVLFAALFATYAVLKANTNGGPGSVAIFSGPFVLLETLLLLTSSFTAGLGLFAARAKQKARALWLLCTTALLGTAFVALEVSEFGRLMIDGAGPTQSGFLSSYFALVGTHGLHVTVGLFWMVALGVSIFSRGLTSNNLRKLTLLTLFWHFLDLVWIFIFTIVYMLGML